jgi:uncharacterized protein with PIN domain
MNGPNDHNRQAIRFYCDEMLKRLGRWLRAAGYDTRIQENAGSDRTMLQAARREGRLLVTRDRKLMEFHHAAGTIILLRGNTLNECIAGLSGELQLDWLYRPFSRCLVCNTELAKADRAAWDCIPETARTHAQRLYWCATCTRIYWEGGHVRRMRARLAAWNDRSGKTI